MSDTTPETPTAAEQLEEHRNKVARAGDALLPIVKAVRDVDAYAKELRRKELEAETPTCERCSQPSVHHRVRDNACPIPEGGFSESEQYAATPTAGQVECHWVILGNEGHATKVVKASDYERLASKLTQTQGAVQDGGDAYLAALSETMRFAIAGYLLEYELRGDEGSYEPTQGERALIEDAVDGLLEDPDFVKAHDAYRMAVLKPALASQLAQAQRRVDELLSECARLTDERDVLARTNAGHMDELQKAFDQVKSLASQMEEVFAERSALRQQLAEKVRKSDADFIQACKELSRARNERRIE